MLLELTISNFIIIDRTSVKFHPQLNILTGETGAGKSILIQAINLALGQKVKNGRSKIRGDKATIELIFDCRDDFIKQHDLERFTGEQGLLVVSREIYSSGKSVSRLNGQVITQSLLRSITQQLIDVHGQHMHQALLDERTHLGTLDRFGGEILPEIKARVKAAVDAHKTLMQQKMELEAMDKAQDLDYLMFQVKEIEMAHIDMESDNSIPEEFERMEHMEEFLSDLNEAQQHMETAANELAAASRSLSSAVRYDHDLEESAARLESAQIEIDDLAMTLHDLSRSMEFDPERFQQLERRIDTLNLLLKKYGPTLDEVVAHKEELSHRIETISGREQLLKSLDEQLETNYLQYQKVATELSNARKEIAKSFSVQIEDEIRTLNLPDIRFEASFSQIVKDDRVKISYDGYDDVIFRISTNRGLNLQPLSEVASGGEISRVMLGIKAVLSRCDMVDTMIFDEIDTGISGETAFLVGKKMRQLSRSKQLISITHLSQIAATADRHFKIEKLEGQSSLTPLSEEERVEEIARIISGHKIDLQSIENSRSLIRQAQAME